MCLFHMKKNLRDYMPKARTFNEAREQILADVFVLENATSEDEFSKGLSILVYLKIGLANRLRRTGSAGRVGAGRAEKPDRPKQSRRFGPVRVFCLP